MGVVLDASALLAYLHEEPGGERVAQVLDGSLVSAVNWAEVVKKSLERGVTVEGMQLEFAAVGVRFEPFLRSRPRLPRAWPYRPVLRGFPWPIAPVWRWLQARGCPP